MKKVIEKAVELYNKYHSPEAEAKILRFDGGKPGVSIRGPFCATCGVIGWFDDLRYEMAMLGVQSQIVSFE